MTKMIYVFTAILTMATVMAAADTSAAPQKGARNPTPTSGGASAGLREKCIGIVRRKYPMRVPYQVFEQRIQECVAAGGR